jgi:hypothetical protein
VHSQSCIFLVANVQQHTLMQFLPGFTSLRALHTIQLRNEDTCHTVHIQFRKFLVDIVANNPEVKLEYIALVDNIERIVRRKKPPKSAKPSDKKGKGKAVGVDNTAKALAELIIGLGSSSAWSDGSSATNGTTTPVMLEWQDSSDDEEVGGLAGLKIETMEGIRFCDVTGVRIFEKDILAGRL